MAQVPKEQLPLTKLPKDDQKPSTSMEESPTANKERKSSDSRAFPSWRFGHTRSSRGSSTRDSVKEEKVDVPNVLRASVVESKIIPPLPRLSMQEEMPDKLLRVMRKLDNLMLIKSGEDDDPKDAAPAPIPGPSKAKTD